MSLKEEIQDAISKNLPAQVGKELQKRLAKADDLEDQISRLTTTLKHKEKELDARVTEIAGLQDIKARQEKFDEELAALHEAQRNFLLAELQYKLECEKDKTAIIQSCFSSLTRNTTFRNHFIGTVPVHADTTMATDSCGNVNTQYPMGSTTVDNTRTIEEE